MNALEKFMKVACFVLNVLDFHLTCLIQTFQKLLVSLVHGLGDQCRSSFISGLIQFVTKYFYCQICYRVYLIGRTGKKLTNSGH